MTRHQSARYVANLAACAGATIAAMALLLLGAASYLSASKYTHPQRNVATTTPASVGLAYEDLHPVTEDGLRLAAWYVPPRDGPTAILLHGLAVNRSQHLGLARSLASRGYGLLIPDLRAHGDSEGDLSTLGVNEVRDVRAAVKFLQGRPEVDQRRLGIYGASLGGATAIMAAAEIGELRAVVADSAFASVDWLVRNQFGSMVSLPPWAAPVVLQIGTLQTGIDAADIAPVRRIAQISPRPVLILHGEIDGFFLVGNAYALAEAAREPKELWIVPSVGHTAAYYAHPDQFVNKIAAFFDASLGRPWGQRRSYRSGRRA